jgi:hypothetical protein
MPNARPIRRAIDDRPDFVAGVGQLVLGHIPLRTRVSGDDGGVFEGAQAIGEDGTRDAGQPALDRVEVAAARKQLS